MRDASSFSWAPDFYHVFDMLQQCAKFHRKSMTNSITRESPLVFSVVCFIIFLLLAKICILTETQKLLSDAALWPYARSCYSN